MSFRWLRAAAALAGAAVVLALAEPHALGDVLSERRGGWLSTLFQQGPYVFGCAALAAALVAAGWLPAPRRPRLSRASAAAFLIRGIPVVDARTVGLFRIVLGLGLWRVLDFHAVGGPGWIQLATRAAIVLFTIGLFSRAALAAASVGVFAWMSLWTQQFGSHPVSALVVALPCLLP